MAQIDLIQYDPVTKKYVAQLTMTEGVKICTYSCEGTWHPEDAGMVARALYDQYKVAIGTAVKIDAEKADIIAAISAEVDKQVAEVEVAHG